MVPPRDNQEILMLAAYSISSQTTANSFTMTMKICIIGQGAIAEYVRTQLEQQNQQHPLLQVDINPKHQQSQL